MSRADVRELTTRDQLRQLLHADAAAQDTEDSFVRAAAADHPAVIECQAAADLLTEYAAEVPGNEQAQLWAFEAVERVTACAWAVAEDDHEAARRHAHAAKGERAAVTLGRLDDHGPMTAARWAALDTDTLALLTWYAAPWPVQWLFPPETDQAQQVLRPRVVMLFHGAGGWSVGIRDILRADVDLVGVDFSPNAVSTARAAGFTVIKADVTDLDPENPALQWVTGIVLSPPCQPFSPSGLRRGRYAAAINRIVSVIRDVGAAAGFLPWDASPTGYAPRTGESWDEVRKPLAGLEDPRAGLMAEVAIWPLAMLTRGGSVEWVAVEQSSALPPAIEQALFAEFTHANWDTEAHTLEAVTYGAASHRKRRFMAAYRNRTPFVDLNPTQPLPVTSLAQCVGWPPGLTVATRGQRRINPQTGRPKGGGTRSADLPATCVTATAYGWRCRETGARISQADIGRLVGFRSNYPWQHAGRGQGIRTKAQQAADAVCPMVAAAVIARVLGIDTWERQARAYARDLYATADRAQSTPEHTQHEQLELFPDLPRQRPTLVELRHEIRGEIEHTSRSPHPPP